MTLSRFMLLNAVLALLDFAVTYGIGSTTDLGPTIARFCGSLTSLVALAIWARLASQPFQSQLLCVVVTVVTVIVNYGLFTLLYLRNPILNWHALFAMSTLAAFVLGAAGYRRALMKKTANR